MYMYIYIQKINICNMSVTIRVSFKCSHMINVPLKYQEYAGLL